MRSLKSGPVVCCRKNSIESFGRRKALVTSEDFREHQADYFASAIAMPKSTFIPLALEILEIKWYYRWPGNNRNLIGNTIGLAEDGFPRLIAKAYGVSRQAAAIKLRKFNFIVAKDNLQPSLF